MEQSNSNLPKTFAEALWTDYMSEEEILREVYKEHVVCSTSGYDEDKYINWKNAATMRMKKIANVFGVDLMYYSTKKTKGEIPVVVTMWLKAFLFLDSKKGGAGSYLQMGKLDKITSDDRINAINLAMNFLSRRYSKISDTKKYVEEGKAILLEKEKYLQTKKKLSKELNDEIENFLDNNVDDFFNEVKQDENELVEEYDFPEIWASIPQDHPESLSLRAKEILLKYFKEYIFQSIASWKNLVKRYASEYNLKKKFSSREEQETYITDLIEQVKDSLTKQN